MEILRKRVILSTIALSLAGSALLGCGDDAPAESTPEISEHPYSGDNNLTPSDSEAIDRGAGTGPDFRIRYYENGTREIVWEDGGEFRQESVVQWCEVGDRYSAFTADTLKGGAGGMQIDLAYPACNDNRLTPEDFDQPG